VLVIAALVAGAAVVAQLFQSRALGAESAPQQPPPGITRTVLVDNDTVLVARLRYEAGKGETSHTHPFSAVVIQLTPGDVDMTLAADHSRAHRDAGTTWFIPAAAPHAAVNVGTVPFDQIAITIKPTRATAPAAPAADAPPGITRTAVIDNTDARVVRVRFAPGGREPVHTHPNDLLTVQLTAGRLEILVGADRTAADREPGFVQFLPRNVAHSYVSTDTKAFELVSVAIK
jgi:quercetin dioxygenase-like cupin family protein